MPPSTLFHHHHHHHLFLLLLLLVLLSCAYLTLSSTSHNHNRRILHLPIFPHDSLPPTPTPSPSPPSPPTTPEYPFITSTPPDTPFFPSYPSPPSHPSFASFPANISSLILPQPHNSKPISTKLIATAVSAIAAASIVVLIAVFLNLRRRRNRASSVTKTSRTDNNATNGNVPKLRRPSQTSSEFLYLGTLVNSHGSLEAHYPPQNARSNDNTKNGSAIDTRKMDSPELRPLPPLSGRRNHANGEVGLARDEESDEFNSPSESSIGTRPASRMVFAPNLNALSSSSSSYSSSSSGSGSPARSVSLSISPPVSLSPKSSRPKSPELVAVQFQITPPVAPFPPPPLGPNEDSLSPSPESSPRISNLVSPMRVNSPVLGLSVAPTPPISVPPPPPLPVLKPAASGQPPVLVTPLMPMAVENPTSISPMQLPSHAENVKRIEESFEKSEETLKPKLKPLHWDKVRASSDHEMVWDQLRSSSFKLNEEMIETLFVVNAPNSNPKETTRWQVLPTPSQENGVLNPKKSQNIAILLKALHVTADEVCEALLEGNADTLGTELLESLLRMSPTKEEERKLKEHKDDSPIMLGPAERFLKAVLDIPFAFKRVDAMLYISNFDSEVEYLKKSFEILEAACRELRNSRMFLKLLEAALKTGNRMNVGTNRGGAHAIKLDTLLKLVDVKGADGKTTLLHFVVQEIIRSEGARLSASNQNQASTVTDDVKCRKLGLQVVSGLSSELTNVKKAAAMDSEVLNSDFLKLPKGLEKIAEVVRLNEAKDSEESSSHKFSQAMNRFMKMAEEEIVTIQAQESIALTVVKELTEYFHGSSAKEEAHPFRIFMVVRDFLSILDRVCKEVGVINEQTIVNTANKFPVPVNPMLQPVSGGLPGTQDHSSSDEESSFP